MLYPGSTTATGAATTLPSFNYKDDLELSSSSSIFNLITNVFQLGHTTFTKSVSNILLINIL